MLTFKETRRKINIIRGSDKKRLRNAFDAAIY